MAFFGGPSSYHQWAGDAVLERRHLCSSVPGAMDLAGCQVVDRLRGPAPEVPPPQPSEGTSQGGKCALILSVPMSPVGHSSKYPKDPKIKFGRLLGPPAPPHCHCSTGRTCPHSPSFMFERRDTDHGEEAVAVGSVGRSGHELRARAHRALRCWLGGSPWARSLLLDGESRRQGFAQPTAVPAEFGLGPFSISVC